MWRGYMSMDGKGKERPQGCKSRGILNVFFVDISYYWDSSMEGGKKSAA
jgi:hypothetical protein